MFYRNITELVGKTPMMNLLNIEKNNNLQAKIFAKLEYFNPAGSIKDRVALSMILSAQNEGKLKDNSVIIEPTSGNTGIGLAAFGSYFGYRVILTMPDTMSTERQELLKAYGAEIVLTEGALGMQGAVAKAIELSETIPDSYIPSQFENSVNPQTHFETTGKEIWEDLNGNVDILVAGVGTGGTISGCGNYLKVKNPNVKVVAVEPFSSPLLSQGYAGKHGLQGIGANFVPNTLDKDVIDEIITVTEEEAYKSGKELANQEGLLVGISSGAALFAAKVLANRIENIGKNIVVILPDTGERYLSTPMFK
jgi:cysteine synthase A